MSNFCKSKSLQLCHIIKREDQERKKLAQIVDFFTCTTGTNTYEILKCTDMGSLFWTIHYESQD